jgi:hypothetical protein
MACSIKEINEPSTECMIDIDTLDFTFGIDYTDTLTYLTPGEQSDLDDVYLEEVRTAIGSPENKIEDILGVCHWMDENFTFENAGGGMIGKVDVNELFEVKKFYGCHSAALIISSTVRKFGFPVIMIETFDVQWAYDFHYGKTESYAGHVMSEVYVEGKWILLDNNGRYVEEYNPLDPFIPMPGNSADDYFVFAKGLDTQDYSGGEESFTFNQLNFYSDNVYCFEKMFNTIQYEWKF